MRVIHRVGSDGTLYTTCLYELDGQPSSANLLGHLTPGFALLALETLRKGGPNLTI